MAIPEDRKSISTNLPFSKLNAVLDAVDNESVKWDGRKTRMLGESCHGEFVFEGARYALEEMWELTEQVELIAAKPEYVKILLDELESQLAEVVGKRKYRKAEKLNEKIESLKSVKILA